MQIESFNNGYALLIGVGGSDIPETVNDAKAISELLIDPNKAAYSKDNVTLLTEENASRKNVINELDKLIELTDKDKDSTVMVYFSGHGGMYSSNEQDSKYYLLTSGYDQNDKENTMVSGDEFSSKLFRIKAERLLVILDCCHASGMIEDDSLIKRKNPVEEIINSNIELIKKLKEGKGRVYIASCDDHEQSLIFKNDINSLFTKILLEALSGAASGGEDFVNIIDILYHTLREVPSRLKKFIADNNLRTTTQQRPIVKQALDLSSDYYVCRNSQIFKENIRFISKGNSASLESVLSAHDIENSIGIIDVNNNSIKEINIEEEVTFISNKISDGELQEVLPRFISLASTQPSRIRMKALQLSAMFNHLYESKFSGDIKESEYQFELNRITGRVLHFLTKIKNR